MPSRSAPAVVYTLVLTALLCFNQLTHAQVHLHEGQHFLVGFIHPQRAPGEPPGKNAYRVIVSSRFDANVVVAGKKVAVAPNTSVELTTDSCDVALVTSDKPITVASRIFMPGNGEQTVHIPTHAWGTRYYPFSWWTDRYGLDTMRYASAQRLVIAREDGTVVKVYSKTSNFELTLNSGEHAYLPVDPDTSHYRNIMSDPTGEVIIANRPIGVISGHAKTAILEHPDALPTSGPYARPANRSRGTLMEVMIPAEHAGTIFVTVPFLYSPTRKRGLDQSDVGIADDRGDVIRFIGTDSNTILSYVDTTGIVIVDTLNDGDIYTARGVETARVWLASRPALCAQYGKSYAHITSQATLPEDDPSTDAGLPMLVSIPSTNQWISHAMFSCPQDLTNYVTVVCRTEHASSIILDGKQMSVSTTSTKMAGNEFTFMRTMVSPGSHRITTTLSDATFLTLTYGNLDGLQLCNAYASTTGIYLASPCKDSLASMIEMDQDTARIDFAIYSQDSCNDVGIAMLYELDSYNSAVSVSGQTAKVVRLKASDTAFALVQCITHHGSAKSARVSFNSTTSIRMTDELLSRGVYPNPCNTSLRIPCTHCLQEIQPAVLVNIYGQRFEFAFGTSESHVIDLSDLTPGLYNLIHHQHTAPVFILR